MLDALLATGKAGPAPIAGFALFAGGLVGGADVSTSVRYEYTAATYTAGANLGLARRFFSGTGNTTVGVMHGGYATINYGDKYTYSNNTVVQASNLTAGRSYSTAAGSATLGLWFGGWLGSGNGVTNTDRYTYATNAVAATTALNVGRYGACAASSDLRAIIKGGYNSTYSAAVESMIISSGARATLTSLAAGKAYPCAAGTVNFAYMFGGLIASGGTATVEKHNHSTDGVTAGTNLTVGTYQSTATGDTNMGIIAGNNGSPGTFTNKYTYSNDTCVVTTALAAASSGMAGCSSTPGNL